MEKGSKVWREIVLKVRFEARKSMEEMRCFKAKGERQGSVQGYVEVGSEGTVEAWKAMDHPY
jgi:hypothetical protein